MAALPESAGLVTLLPRPAQPRRGFALASLDRPWGLILRVAVPFYVAINIVSLTSFVLTVMPNKDVLLLPLGVRVAEQFATLALAAGCYRLALGLGWPTGTLARLRVGAAHLALALLVGVSARPLLIAIAQLVIPAPEFGWRSFTNFSGYGAKLWLASTLDTLVMYFFGLALLAGVRVTLALRAAQLARSELEHAWTTARLQALRMQLNPHFLFNAFNTIATLLESEPLRARALVLNISDLFRRTLAVAEVEWSPLEEELAFARDYLELQAARYAGRIRYAVEAAPGTPHLQVPALLLQPLVENAALHGVADDRDSLSIWVGTRLAGTPPMLVLEVGNRSTGRLPAPGEGSGAGVGLANTRARLAACYGTRATLAYGPSDEHSYLVTVTLPAAGGAR